jgi:hypothetical protein
VRCGIAGFSALDGLCRGDTLSLAAAVEATSRGRGVHEKADFVLFFQIFAVVVEERVLVLEEGESNFLACLVIEDPALGKPDLVAGALTVLIFIDKAGTVIAEEVDDLAEKEVVVVRRVGDTNFLEIGRVRDEYGSGGETHCCV